MLERRLIPHIMSDLFRQKMVFISGPRQSGKTTLTNHLPVTKGSLAYYTWDAESQRKLIRDSKLDEAKEYWVLDEVHKYKRWKNLLKGLYDIHKSDHKIVVTGSARLEMYSRGGDSLQGRYFNYRLHPLTLSEYAQEAEQDYRQLLPKIKIEYEHNQVQGRLNDLLRFGGFPEPLLARSEDFSGRWRLAYGQRLVREDVRTLEQTQELDQMELLFERLPDLVGNNLSINNLSQDLEVAHQTVTKWIRIFEKLYACFYVLPWGGPRIKAIKKEKKLYLWDWSFNQQPGARLENLVAVHLLRLVHWFEDIYGEVLDLRYFRDADGHEVDFIILRKKQPWMAIEVKSSEQDLDTGFRYFLKRISVPYAFQIHLKSDLDSRIADINGCRIRTMPAAKFLMALP